VKQDCKNVPANHANSCGKPAIAVQKVLAGVSLSIVIKGDDHDCSDFCPMELCASFEWRSIALFKELIDIERGFGSIINVL
jgi:hypothetical protein